MMKLLLMRGSDFDDLNDIDLKKNLSKSINNIDSSITT